MTDASSGMGKEMPLLFAKVASSFSGKIVTMEADITIDKDIVLVVNFIRDKYGRIDVLVNSAGVMDDISPVGDLTD